MAEVTLYYNGDSENGRQLQNYLKEKDRLSILNREITIHFVDTKYKANEQMARQNHIQRTPTLTGGTKNPLVGNTDIFRFFEFVIKKVSSTVKEKDEPIEDENIYPEEEEEDNKAFDPRQSMAEFAKRRAQMYEKYKGSTPQGQGQSQGGQGQNQGGRGRSAMKKTVEVETFDDDQAFLKKSGRDFEEVEEDNIAIADETETLLEDYYNKEADDFGRKVSGKISKRR